MDTMPEVLTDKKLREMICQFELRACRKYSSKTESSMCACLVYVGVLLQSLLDLIIRVRILDKLNLKICNHA